MDTNRSNDCIVCTLSFNSMKDFLKHTLSGEHQKRAREIMMDLAEAETKGAPPLPTKTIPKNMKVVFDLEEEDYTFRNKKPLPTAHTPKGNTKDTIKTKGPPALVGVTRHTLLLAEAEADDGPEAMLRHNIYSKIKFICNGCIEEFKIALTAHSYSHNRKYLENTEYFDRSSRT